MTPVDIVHQRRVAAVAEDWSWWLPVDCLALSIVLHRYASFSVPHG